MRGLTLGQASPSWMSLQADRVSVTVTGLLQILERPWYDELGFGDISRLRFVRFNFNIITEQFRTRVGREHDQGHTAGLVYSKSRI